MQGNNMELGYDKKVLIAHYIDELIKRFKININAEDKEALVKETQNVVGLIAKENLLSSQQLKQDTKDSLEKELATKEFVRSEVAKVRTEIAETKTDLIKWIVGMQLAVGGLIVALIKFL
ncbi:hypothetical protein [Campylobacter helveticus]|uniref:hypothetical protein n=1 Tax=Campylobacter helveticus TaxID=28898 RepID=UPI00214A10E1|nr:hypothetical protein [Campylobacter helveticus]MCR2064367.1 hypothetical protein [Campylobacter helveticus]